VPLTFRPKRQAPASNAPPLPAHHGKTGARNIENDKSVPGSPSEETAKGTKNARHE